MAFAKSQLAAGQMLPQKGTVFISVKNRDKRLILSTAKKLSDLGFRIVATRGTARFLERGRDGQLINKVREGRPNVVDHIKNREIELIINTPSGSKSDPSRFHPPNGRGPQYPLSSPPSPGPAPPAEAIEALLQEEHPRETIQEYHSRR